MRRAPRGLRWGGGVPYGREWAEEVRRQPGKREERMGGSQRGQDGVGDPRGVRIERL